MREAIGSSWIIYLVITVILVYVFFIAFVMNYAAAYRAANYVVTQIENCQARMDNCKDMVTIADEVRTKYHYHSSIDPCYVSNGNGSYVFRVNLKVDFDLPGMGRLGIAHVRAETKSINTIKNISTDTNFSKCS